MTKRRLPEEGAKTCRKKVWNRAVYLRRRMLNLLCPTLGKPIILPCYDGSVDLHWKNDRFEVLINFPTGPEAPKYYADDFGINRIHNHLNKETQKFLLGWLRVVGSKEG